MEILNYEVLEKSGYDGYILKDAPEKVMQFGEGNFLRAFVDYWFDVSNEKADWNGKCVLVQPIKFGLADMINKQEGLYTLYLRGRENGEKVDRKRVISSVSRCLNPYEEEGYKAMMELAVSDDLEYIVSNTTEAGIVYDPSCQFEDKPANSFPGKLTQVLYERFKAGKYPLASLVETHLDASLPETQDDRAKAAVEAQAVRALAAALEKKLEEDGTVGVYRDIDAPLVGPLAVMERNGAPIDATALADLGASTQTEIDALKASIHELAGEEFNVDSPKQLGHILFEVLGMPHGKKTKSGYSTDAQVLKKLALDYELPAIVLRYREFAKIKSTYIDALPNIARQYGDGRVHTSFNETVTATGRLSSSDPNLQNIPVRTDFGRKIRSCFGPLNPKAGDVFLSADYSQIELRLLAHLSGDEHLVAAFNSGADFHASTAARVFGVPVEDVTPQMRSRAKAVNFGIVYGQQAFGLAQSLEIPMAEAKDMIDRYFEAYPGVRAYLDRTVEEARQRGYAETMFGRRRHIPELAARNAVQRGFGERTAMNHPMQGSAADIIKIAMNQVSRRLVADGFKAKLLIQVHDELDFSVPADEVESLSTMVKDVMEHAAELQVPLIADVSYGPTWADAH